MMLQNLIAKLLIVGLIVIQGSSAMATTESRRLVTDSRVRVMNYRSNEVFKYTGYYGYQGSIEFEEGETIETISMGDTVSWQMVPSGNRLFLKPIEHDATTNMTLITSKRTYLFELHAKEAKNIKDPGMAFVVKFLYQNNLAPISATKISIPSEPNLQDYKKYNFRYTISGSAMVSPIKVFDNGEFTYFEFKDKNAPLPAFFEVDAAGEESIINYQVSASYIVVESVAKQFTLRYGGEVVSVFNESMS